MQAGLRLCCLQTTEARFSYLATHIIKPVHNKILVLIALSNKEGLGEAVQIHRLVRAFAMCIHQIWMYSKTCLKWPLSKRPKVGFQVKLSLDVGQRYCRMLQWEHFAILSTFIKQYFRPSVSYHLSLRPLFCLFLSGCLRQALL